MKTFENRKFAFRVGYFSILCVLALAFVLTRRVESPTTTQNIMASGLSVEELRRAAEQDDAQALFELGLRLWKTGSEEDRFSAHNLFHRAAELGYAPAQKIRGDINRLGMNDRAVPPEWLDKVNALNDMQSHKKKYNEGFAIICNEPGNSNSVAKGIELLKQAALLGHFTAAYKLGEIFEEVQYKVQNESEAVRWYKVAADQGYTFAQQKLGTMCLQGRGIPKNPQKAVYWYRLAAEHGSASAAVCLGECLLSGTGTSIDVNEAFKWFSYANEKGIYQSDAGLGECYAKGLGVEKNVVKAIDHFTIAADQGYVPGMVKLGLSYADGTFGEIDYPKAFFYLERAVRGGSKEAELLADQLLERTLEKK